MNATAQAAQATQEELDIGRRLQYWHDGKADPIYQVGSLLIAGKSDQVTAELYDSCHINLRKLLSSPICAENIRFVDRLINNLESWWINKQHMKSEPLKETYQVQKTSSEYTEMYRLACTLDLPTELETVFDDLSLFGDADGKNDTYQYWTIEPEMLPAVLRLIIHEGFTFGQLLPNR